MLTRRAFLAAAGASYFAALPGMAQETVLGSQNIFAATCKFKDESFGFVVLTDDGQLIAQHKLPGRGHDLVQCVQSGKIAVFARRSGVYAAIFDGKNTKPAMITAPADRHFYGHGVFRSDGKLLLTTENDFENARGVIGVYDLSGDAPTRIGEFDSYGIGPHDVQISADQKYLIVANGGIETHPDFGRTKLNLSTMAPNIAWIDLNDGALVVRHQLPADLHKLSLRHMTNSDKKGIWVGGQFQETAADDIPLVAHVSLDRGIQFLPLTHKVQRRLEGYVGSIEQSQDGERLAISSPKGNQLLITNLQGEVLHQRKLDDVCAISPVAQNNFQFGTGYGEFGSADGAPLHLGEIYFDNHMINLRKWAAL